MSMKWGWRRAALLLVQAALWFTVTSGCASAGVEFRPYLSAMPHKPLLERAVSVDRRDVPALAQAGGIIIGHISAHGMGIQGASALEESAAIEAARKGGTHLIAETQRAQAYQPAATLELSFLVVRLSDVRAMAQLAERLQPHAGVHYQGRLETDWAEVESASAAAFTEPEPDAEHPRGPVHVVDGRHLKPLH